MLTMSAFVCDVPEASSIAVVAHFPGTAAVLCSQPGHQGWEVIHHGLELANILPFQGRLYATLRTGSCIPKRVVMVYPPDTSFMTHHELHSSCDFLVECCGRMLLVQQHITLQRRVKFWQNFAFKIFEVDLSLRKLIPVKCLGNWALFLNTDRCLSVSAKDLPSIRGNSVYFSLPLYPAVLHSLASGVSEELSASCQIHDTLKRIRPSVRPFTLAHHLLTYCHHNEWTRGLMIHEYHLIPESFEELHKKIEAQDSQLQIPRAGAGAANSKLLSSS